MANTGQLERQMGELKGILDRLTPELARIEGRQNDTGRDVARMDQEISTQKGRVNEVVGRLDDGDKAFELLRKEVYQLNGRMEKGNDDLARDISDIITEINVIKGSRSSTLSKLWDVVKLVIAAALGGACAALFGG